MGSTEVPEPGPRWAAAHAARRPRPAQLHASPDQHPIALRGPRTTSRHRNQPLLPGRAGSRCARSRPATASGRRVARLPWGDRDTRLIYSYSAQNAATWPPYWNRRWPYRSPTGPRMENPRIVVVAAINPVHLEGQRHDRHDHHVRVRPASVPPECAPPGLQLHPVALPIDPPGRKRKAPGMCAPRGHPGHRGDVMPPGSTSALCRTSAAW
jgi:hypothetical protein